MSQEETGTTPVSVTIKYGTGFDEPWIVFRGDVTSVTAQIMEAFGIVGANSLHEAVDMAKAIATGGGFPQGFAATLDAKVVEDGPADNTGENTPQEATGAPVSDDQTEDEEDSDSALIEALGCCESMRELRQLYVDNASYFKDASPELRKAYNDKATALRGE